MTLSWDQWATAFLRHAKECERFIFSNEALAGGDGFIELAMNLAQVNNEPDNPSELMSVISMMLIIGTYSSILSGSVKKENLNRLYGVKEELIDVAIVEYSAIAHLVRSHPKFSYSARFKDCEVEANPYILSLIGYKTMSLLNSIIADDVEGFRLINNSNKKEFGELNALNTMVENFSSVHFSSGAECRKEFINDDCIRIAEIASRVFRPIYGLVRNHEQYRSVIKFSDTGDISWVGKKVLTRWIDKAKDIKPTFRAGNNYLLAEAKSEYNKAISNLIQQGADWSIPLINSDIFELKYMGHANMTDEHKFALILKNISDKKPGLEGVYERAVIKSLTPTFIIQYASQSQLSVCYQITGDRAYVNAINDPRIKRSCLERDMGLSL
jgi:hypothetical protein